MGERGWPLVAILAPGSAEAEVARIQQDIFSRHGFLSSIALPPLVPVSFLGEPALRPGILKELNAMASAPVRFTLGGLAWQEGALYLRVESGGLWQVLREAAGAHGKDAPALFPVSEGFFLGCLEAPAGERDLIRPAPAEAAFSSARLALMRIEAAEAAGQWWRRVSWDIIDEVPLRGRRRS